MNDRHDLLTKIFRERLVNYEQRPETDVWSKIEQQLSAGKRRSILSVWRWVGVAASILLILTAGIIYFSGEKTAENNKIALKEQTEIQYPANEDTPITIHPDTENSLSVQSSPVIRAVAKRTVQATTPYIDTVTDSLTLEEVGEQEQTFQPDIAEQISHEEAKVEEKTNNIPHKKIQLDELVAPDDLWTNNRSSKQKGRIMLVFSVGNSGTNPANLFNRNASDKPIYNYNAIQYYSNKAADFSDESAPQLRSAGSNYNYVLTNVDCKMPLTYSMYFRMQLTPSFAVESAGLSYTYLSSREYYLLQNEPSMVKEMNLHYLGIPIKGVWSVYNKNRFSYYLAGGGSIEKCINGKEKVSVLETSSTSALSIPDLQFSVAGSIGANYLLGDRLGVFVEPGVSYFFDDGSEVRTIRKKTPFNFQVQGGIRMMW